MNAEILWQIENNRYNLDLVRNNLKKYFHYTIFQFDFLQVARKLGLEGRDQMRTDSNNGIMPHHPRRKEESLGLASSPGQASSLPSPPSPLPHAHAAESNGNERLRRISCE